MRRFPSRAASATALTAALSASLVLLAFGAPAAGATPNGSSPSSLTRLGSTLFFTAAAPGSGRELWKSDGTPGGTALVKDIRPGPGRSMGFWSNLVPIGGRLFFTAFDGSDGHLYTSDGTTAGTRKVKPFFPGGFAPDDITNVAGTAYLILDNDLWTSDGTAPGTVFVESLGDPKDFYLDEFTASGGLLYFVRRGGLDDVVQLWRSDGTPEGTRSIASLGPAINWDLEELTDVGGTLFFTRWSTQVDGEHPISLWKSDGTASGTKIVRDIVPSADDYPFQLVAFLGDLFFSVGGTSNRQGLWRSDGTSAGTTRVKAMVTAFSPRDVSGTLFFFHAAGLWTSDGTGAGTVHIEDLERACCRENYNEAHVGATFYMAVEGAGGAELWKSDGTPFGTRRVRDVRPGPASSEPTNLVNVGGVLYFVADDGVHGRELWRSDGTAAGTYLVKDIA